MLTKSVPSGVNLPTETRLRRFVGAFLTAMLAIGIIVAPSAAAHAAEKLTWALDPLGATVYAGDNLTYGLQLQCSEGSGVCTESTIYLTAPPAASGPGALADPLPPGVSFEADEGGIWVTYNGESSLSGATTGVSVAWPTENYTSTPGPQPVNLVNNGVTEKTASINLLADVTLTLDKTGPTRAHFDDVVMYNITAKLTGLDTQSSNHGTLEVRDAIITDTLPEGAVFESCSDECTVSGNLVTWNLGTLRGDKNVVLRVVFPAEPGVEELVATNHAEVTGTKPTGDPLSDESDWVVTLTEVGSGGELDVDVLKLGPAAWDGQEDYSWEVRFTNHSSGQVRITAADVIPAGFNVWKINAGVPYSVAGAEANITHADGYTAGAKPLDEPDPELGGGSLTVPESDASAHGRVSQVDLALNVAVNETVVIRLVARVDIEEVVGDPSAVENCVTGEAELGGTSEGFRACTTVEVHEDPFPSWKLEKRVGQTPVAPGGTHVWTLTATNTSTNGALLQSEFVDLIPNSVSYQEGSWGNVATNADECPLASTFSESIEENWQSAKPGVTTQYTRVKWVGPAETQIPEGVDCAYTFRTTVNPGVVPGTLTGNSTDLDSYLGNNAGLYDAAHTVPAQGLPGVSEDVHDLNSDGSTTEAVYMASTSFAVADSALLWITKHVNGDKDGDEWFDSAEKTGMSDQVAHATPGGEVSYRVRIGNLGNRDLTKVVSYDLLPNPGNPGVTTIRHDDQPQGAGNEWRPTMTGPISEGDAAGLVTISYSTSADPCRPEMDNRDPQGQPPLPCEEPGWQLAAAVADWSEIRSVRYDFGATTIKGGTSYTFEWTMDAPTTLADGSTPTGGERTWNKVAVQAAAAETEGELKPLLAAEAPWVVAELEAAVTPEIETYLTLVKRVENTHGGTATPDEWELHAAGPTPISGVTGTPSITEAVVSPGEYDLSETGRDDYDASQWSCTAGTLTGSSLVLEEGDRATCTITNTDREPPVIDPPVTTPPGVTPPGPTPPIAQTGAAGSWPVVVGGGALLLLGAAALLASRRRARRS